MAHNLNELNGVVSFVENAGKERKNIAWHGLGQQFDRALSTKEILEMPNFSYMVDKGAMLHITKEQLESILNGEPINHLFSENDIVPNMSCTFREDTNQILGVVSNSYEIVQNKNGFDFIDKITGADGSNPLANGAVIETAGVLNNGETIFITAKMPNNIRIGDNKDEINDYLLFTNGHDGLHGVTVCFTPIRVVCNNTLNAALNGSKNKYSFKHTANVHNKLAMAETVMNLHSYFRKDFEENMNFLSKQELSEQTIKNLVCDVFLTPEENGLYRLADFNLNSVDEISTRKKNTINDLLNYIDNGVGQETNRGTAYWVYNGFTSFYNNKKQYKDETKKFNSILKNGEAIKYTQKAYDKLMALVA